MALPGEYDVTTGHLPRNYTGRRSMMEIVQGPCLKVLVAYYSFTGNTRTVAQEIREKTCGVLFSVETHTAYLGRTVEADARRERECCKLPALKYAAPCMSRYDFILVGGPVWHCTLPTPLLSFLRDADFAGRRVAAFCTHEKGSGAFFQNFKSRAHNAQVLGGLRLNMCHYDCGSAMSAVLDSWLHTLGIIDCGPSRPETVQCG